MLPLLLVIWRMKRFLLHSKLSFEATDAETSTRALRCRRNNDTKLQNLLAQVISKVVK